MPLTENNGEFNLPPDRKVCIVLAFMRTGSTVLSHALASNPDVFGSKQDLLNILMTKHDLSRKSAIDIYGSVLYSMRQDLGATNGVFISRTHKIADDVVNSLLGLDTHFIVPLRDPREIILSAKRWATDPFLKTIRNANNVPVEQYCKRFVAGWLQAYKLYKRLETAGEKVYLAKHDMICIDPRRYAVEIFDWLDVDSSETSIDLFTSMYTTGSKRHEEDDYWKQIITKDMITKAKEIGFDI